MLSCGAALAPDQHLSSPPVSPASCPLTSLLHWKLLLDKLKPQMWGKDMWRHSDPSIVLQQHMKNQPHLKQLLANIQRKEPVVSVLLDLTPNCLQLKAAERNTIAIVMKRL